MANAYQLSLLITEKCNLHCIYCHCDQSLKSMDLTTAIQAVRDIVERRPCEEQLNVLFMGGEPFLEFELIKDTVAQAREEFPEKKILFKAVSNGTLIHNKIQDWLLENRDCFEVSISLDGDRDTHNANRCNSYDRIDFDFFQNRYNRHMTVSSVVVPEMLPVFADNVIHIEKQGFKVKYALADGIRWNIDIDAPKLSTELNRLIDYYISNPEKYPFNLLSYAIYCINGKFTANRCTPFKTSHCIAIDEEKYGCYRCTSLYNNGTWQIPQEQITLENVGLLRNECETCCVKKICNACPATVAAIKSDEKQSLNTCTMNRVLFMANAMLVVKMFTKTPDHVFLRTKNKEMKMELLNGAMRIMKELKL